MLFFVICIKNLCVFWKEFLMSDTETADSATDYSSHGPLYELRPRRMAPQNNNVWMTVLKVFVILAFFTGAGIGAWRIYEAIKAKSKEPSEPDRKDFSSMTSVDPVTETPTGQRSSRRNRKQGLYKFMSFHNLITRISSELCRAKGQCQNAPW